MEPLQPVFVYNELLVGRRSIDGWEEWRKTITNEDMIPNVQFTQLGMSVWSKVQAGNTEFLCS